MLHTLLPINERKTLRREYRIRALIVLCFTLSVAGVIGIVSLFPSFIRATIEARGNEKALAAFKRDKDDSGLTTIEHNLSQYQALLTTLQAPPLRSRFSDLIPGLVSLRGPIRITSISVSKGQGTDSTVSLQIFAATRDDLLALKSRFEQVVSGNRINLPISALAKSTDIAVTLQFNEPMQ